MKVLLSSEIRRYLTVCLDLCGNQISASLRHRRDGPLHKPCQPNSLLDFSTQIQDKAWLFFLALIRPNALSSWRIST